MARWTRKIQAMGYAVANRPFYPEGLGLSRRLILHISDTPMEIYPFLYRVVRRLRPVEIIHTGDMADNYKIEFQDFHRAHYQQAVTGFVHHIRQLTNGGIHIAMGNHDDLSTLQALFPEDRFDTRTIQLYGRPFHLTHELQHLPQEEGYHCFGHKFTPETDLTSRCMLLNGLLRINLIDVDDWSVYQLSYPLGTNGFRRMTGGRLKL